MPEKILHTTIEIDDSTLELWNIRAVPGSMHGEEKIKILDNTYNRIVTGSSHPCILTGVSIPRTGRRRMARSSRGGMRTTGRWQTRGSMPS